MRQVEKDTLTLGQQSQSISEVQDGIGIYSIEPDDTEESKLQLHTVEMQQNTSVEQSLQEPSSIAEAE